MTTVSTEQFLLQLQASDVQVWLDGERVRVSVPKDVVIPGLREELAARKADIVAFLSSLPRDAVTADEPPLAARADASPVPLSFGQQRVWMLHELNKDLRSPYDTLTLNVRLRGALDIVALRRSLDAIVGRHEVLRTTFRMDDAEPVQIVAAVAEAAFDTVDLRDRSADESAALTEQLLRAAKETLFDLAHGPVLRAWLIRLGEAEHILAIALHHIVFDAWSMGILTRELGLLYRGFVAGRPAELPALPLQYGDFALWQRRWMQGSVLTRHLDYWEKQLAGLELLELPLDRPRPALQSYAGDTATLRIDAAVSAALTDVAKANSATPFMVLLAALGMLLARYSGQTDVAIGTPITNRDRPELQGLIGYFLNTLVMRLDLSGDPAFATLLPRVRRVVLDGFAHQHLPFELLVERLKLERDPSRSPLFQVLFVMQNAAESAPLQLGELDGVPIAVAGATTRFDLEFYLYHDAAGFSANCVYNTDLFEAETVQRMLGHYANLLAAVAADAQRPLGALPLLDAQERQRVLVEWNATARTRSADVTVQQLFEAQAQRSPDAIALDDGAQRLTYRALSERSNQLARHLRDLGVTAGTVVGVCAERSVALVVGLLGVLKAGAAYLPLDSAHPRERLAYVMEDAGACVVVTENPLRDLLPAHETSVLLDAAALHAVAQGPVDVAGAVGAETPAYVIYTSGSTGKPKGVRVPQRAVVNFLQAMTRQPGATSTDVLLAVTTVAFDIHVLEIFLPLVTGARVYLANRDTASDGRRLLALLRDTGATLMQATPTTWRMLIDAGWSERLPLKALCGGEPLPPDLARQLAARCAEVWNMYGPTETTVWSSMYRVAADAQDVLVGRPIDNTRFYLLDARGEPVPIGVTGELYIGGAGVADGYVNRPELTAERFVADRFGGGEGARLYRTGDLARYRADGNVQLLGRVDQQVKLRGFRIELGEVEAVLLEHPDVRAAVVVLDAHAGDPRLVAYTIPRAGLPSDARPGAGELRDFLRERLPYYMLPAAVVWLDAFPLTGSGKIDRKALPAPARTLDRPPQNAAAPHGELEIVMARIWAELLDVEDIQAFDTFFDLGGHSLLSLKVVERFERETRLRISPVDLVNQTLRQLIAGIERRPAAAHGDAATTGTPGTRGASLLQTIKGAFSRGG